MHAILSLRPNVTREEAIACFQPPGLFGWLRRARTGPLRRIADAYVPFRLYRVGIRNGARSQLQLLALDAVSGSLDLYAFDRVPEAGQLVPIETRNVPLALLEEARSRELLAERVRRILYRTGFFRLRNPQISAELVPVESLEAAVSGRFR